MYNSARVGKSEYNSTFMTWPVALRQHNMYHCPCPDSLPPLSESWDNATLLAQQVASVDAVVGPDTYTADVKYIAQSATQDVGAFHRMSCASNILQYM